MDELRREVELIKQRNRNVEADKAWEISTARKIILAILTYIALLVYMLAVGISDPWWNALGAAAAFMISTLTLGYFKKIWIERIYRKNKAEPEKTGPGSL